MAKGLIKSVGFSLAEFMVVIAIIGLLVVVATPSYVGYVEKAKFSEIFSIVSSQLNTIQIALDTGNQVLPIVSGTSCGAQSPIIIGNYITHMIIDSNFIEVCVQDPSGMSILDGGGGAVIQFLLEADASGTLKIIKCDFNRLYINPNWTLDKLNSLLSSTTCHPLSS